MSATVRTENKLKEPAKAEGREALKEGPLSLLKLPEREKIPGVRTPREIKEWLDRYVIGNERAKRVLAVIAHNHFKRNGLQLSLRCVEKALKRHFVVVGSDELYKEYVNLFARLVRREKLDRGKNNPIRVALKVLIEHGIKRGIVEPKVETFRMRVAKSGARRRNRKQKEKSSKLLSPSLDTMAYRVLLTLMRERKKELGEEQTFHKESAVLIGPSGSGKTYIVRTLARFLDVPFVVVDASQITEPGYEGEDALNIPKLLLDAAGGDVRRASRGIVFLDEICKKAGRGGRRAGSDVSGYGAQASLLRIMEDHVDQKTGVDMSGVLFIAAGTFSGLMEIVRRRLNVGGIGFSRDKLNLDRQEDLSYGVLPEDLINYGLMRELVGRLGTIVMMDPVDRDLMRRILLEAEESPLRIKRALLDIDGISIELTKDGIEEIVKIALRQRTGARALQSVLSAVTEGLEFDGPELDRKMQQGPLIIDKSFVRYAIKQHTGLPKLAG